MADPCSAIAHAAAVLARVRIDLSNEKATQAGVEEALAAAGIACEREMALSGRDRPDFFLTESGVAIEVKLRGRKMEIWRQLSRYAEHDRVRGVMLLSATAMTLPPEINGKPLGFLSLGRAWL